MNLQITKMIVDCRRIQQNECVLTVMKPISALSQLLKLRLTAMVTLISFDSIFASNDQQKVYYQRIDRNLEIQQMISHLYLVIILISTQ